MLNYFALLVFDWIFSLETVIFNNFKQAIFLGLKFYQNLEENIPKSQSVFVLK